MDALVFGSSSGKRRKTSSRLSDVSGDSGIFRCLIWSCFCVLVLIL
jgi:hypothetical protein